MKRPCTCDKPTCRLCRLFHGDPAYRRLWSGEAPAMQFDRSRCVHLGAVVDRTGFAGQPSSCSRCWVRQCDLFGECRLNEPHDTTRPSCQTCDRYEE